METGTDTRWYGWLACDGWWERISGPDTLSATHRAVVKAQGRRGCQASLHGCLTGGAPPRFPPPAECCRHGKEVAS